MANMGSNRPWGIISKVAGGNIGAYRIVTFGADALHVVQTDAVTQIPLGVTVPGTSSDPSALAVAEDTVDYATQGTPAVEYGATVTRGQRLTSDSKGRAIPASTGNQSIGIAQEDGVTGDIGSVQIEIGKA